jgi:hypothetical protein
MLSIEAIRIITHEKQSHDRVHSIDQSPSSAHDLARLSEPTGLRAIKGFHDEALSLYRVNVKVSDLPD